MTFPVENPTMIYKKRIYLFIIYIYGGSDIYLKGAEGAAKQKANKDLHKLLFIYFPPFKFLRIQFLNIPWSVYLTVKNLLSVTCN